MFRAARFSASAVFWIFGESASAVTAFAVLVSELINS